MEVVIYIFILFLEWGLSFDFDKMGGIAMSFDKKWEWVWAWSWVVGEKKESLKSKKCDQKRKSPDLYLKKCDRRNWKIIAHIIKKWVIGLYKVSLIYLKSVIENNKKVHPYLEKIILILIKSHPDHKKSDLKKSTTEILIKMVDLFKSSPEHKIYLDLHKPPI